MSEAEFPAELVERCAIKAFRSYEDCSDEWFESWWPQASLAEHCGDCALAEHKGPMTCDRCTVEEWRRHTIAVLCESGHKELVEALREYEAWEADLILTGDWKSEFPRMTAAQYDKMIELQTKRNEALRKAGSL